MDSFAIYYYYFRVCFLGGITVRDGALSIHLTRTASTATGAFPMWPAELSPDGRMHVT